MKKLFEKILLEDVEEKLTSIHIDNQIEPKSNVIHNFNKLEIPELTDSISEYTQGSKQINRNLWEFKNKNNTIDYNMSYMINDIHKALDKSNPAHDNMSVYSGVRRNPQELVKESGGILHHAPFISSSISPSVGMGFSDPVETVLSDGSKQQVRHILKIKIRKGQKVGGYIGDKSRFSTEREYLLKANQLLKIHPEPEEVSLRGYDGKVKSMIHIHHAIILDPHEYEDLSEHKEVQSHKKLKEVINSNPIELNTNHINNYISTKLGKDIYEDKDFVSNFKLEPHHIDKIISKDYLHEELSHKQELSPHHIDYLLNGEPSLNTMVGLSKQKNLKSHQVDRLLNKDDHDIINGLLDNSHNVLMPHHIDKLIDKNIILHRNISKLHKLSSEHIDKLINIGDARSLDNLSSREDLNHKHIDKLISSNRSKVLENISNNSNISKEQIDNILDKNEFNSGYNLASNGKLDPAHIDKLIDRKDSRISNILSYRKDLTDNHISKLIENSKGDYNFVKSDLLRNINNNYKLNDEHIHKIFSNSSGYNEVLLNHVIKKQVGKNNVSKFIEHPYIRDNIKGLTEEYFKIMIRSPI